MKYTAIFAACLAATTVFAGAIDPNTVDPCIKGCVSDAASAVGCSDPLDASCLCGSKRNDFTIKALTCLQSKCPDKIAQAAGLQSQLCG
ncbi:uncharacterized protein EHS24_008944 [Apiotrichum porosum]|uniref:CFEM domain-containing protein n=1 Tax=Apiotrichum porosum TaxID=105984 RepID=A0A427XNL3_9TREE|nr:uncharacterized protein EHS24_008944 [Apiotrichum porosum]RSH80368.1 hypothetical protein EHS24_008944 [Apiotrichum porosum]